VDKRIIRTHSVQRPQNVMYSHVEMDHRGNPFIRLSAAIR
jgi:hypothetical protein